MPMWVYVYTWICIHTHMHTCEYIHTHEYAFTHTCTHTHMWVYTYTWICINTDVHVVIYIHLSTHLHTHTCMSVHTCPHAHTCAHTYLYPLSWVFWSVMVEVYRPQAFLTDSNPHPSSWPRLRGKCWRDWFFPLGRAMIDRVEGHNHGTETGWPDPVRPKI